MLFFFCFFYFLFAISVGFTPTFIIEPDLSAGCLSLFAGIRKKDGLGYRREPSQGVVGDGFFDKRA